MTSCSREIMQEIMSSPQIYKSDLEMREANIFIVEKIMFANYVHNYITEKHTVSILCKKLKHTYRKLYARTKTKIMNNSNKNRLRAGVGNL